MVTGLNTSEETFIAYSQDETKQFVNEMKKIELGTADLTKIKLMSPEYQGLLTAFQNNHDNAKLMLTLCNDIPKTVFRQKAYDRVFNILFDINLFPVDTDAMSQTNEGDALLQQLADKGMLYTAGYPEHQTYKKPENLLLDSYFINVELVG